MATKYGALEIVRALRAAIVIAYKLGCFTVLHVAFRIEGTQSAGKQGQVAAFATEIHGEGRNAGARQGRSVIPSKEVTWQRY